MTLSSHRLTSLSKVTNLTTELLPLPALVVACLQFFSYNSYVYHVPCTLPLRIADPLPDLVAVHRLRWVSSSKLHLDGSGQWLHYKPVSAKLNYRSMSGSAIHVSSTSGTLDGLKPIFFTNTSFLVAA